MNHKPHRFPILGSREVGLTGGAPDAELLARFTECRDEAAFELLLRRHSSMVFGACRRLLADPNDADDAFQAVFLILARKAGSIARAEVVSAWLHRVAIRAAMKVRASRASVLLRGGADVNQLPSPCPQEYERAELSHVLDEEIGRLPVRYRTAFMLCCLEGKTGEEAARVLECPPGTVSSRLTRARERLRERLTRRGYAPSVVAALLAGEAFAALPSSRLVDSTLSAALAFAVGYTIGGSDVRSTAIAKGVIRTMMLSKLTIVAAIFAAALLATGAVIAGSVSGNNSDNPVAGEKAPPSEALDGGKKPTATPKVQLVRPKSGGIDRITQPACNAEAVQQADLYPGTTGALKTMNVDIGDRVKKGQLLAEIEAPGLSLDERLAAVRADQAVGLLREAQAGITGAKAEVVAAEAAVRQRQTDANAGKANLDYRKKHFDRIKELFDQKTIDKRTLDEAESLYQAAKTQADAAMATVDGAKADVAVKQGKLTQSEAAADTAKSNVEAAKLGHEKARLALAHTKVIAPFDGIVTRRNLSVGDFVRPDSSAANQSQLYSLVRVDVIRVVVQIPERAIVQVEPGVPAEISFAAISGTQFASKVSRIGYVVDPKTGEMRAEIDVPNPDGKIRPGMFGRATLKLAKGSPDALRVPSAAIMILLPPLGDEKMVYVYREGKARMTRVRTGYTDGNETEVLSGLTAEDRIVTNPMGLLRGDDVPVQIESPEPTKK